MSVPSPAAGVDRAGDGARPTNRLVREKSPYLQQHAHQPVDWHPWGPEAFERARRQNKPLLLSIGYAACHWCHVMSRECFEDEEVARLLNRYFVPVKVDREEHPDVDRLYMEYVVATTGSGGWPLTVWLTPELKPFFGGTYFPREDLGLRPGFITLLRWIAELWATDSARITARGSDLFQRWVASRDRTTEDRTPSSLETLRRAVEQLRSVYDAHHGGFGGAPKFPQTVLLDLLFRHYARTGDTGSLDMALHTLRSIEAGGIHDQLGGGFHRYSTDSEWRVPHFEKMLYDQALIAMAFLDAWRASGDVRFADAVRSTLDFVLREMTNGEGLFLAALDADSEVGARRGVTEEGAFYVWRQDEVLRLLDVDDGRLAVLLFDLRNEGNATPQLPGLNVLYRARSTSEVAATLGQSIAEVEVRVARIRERLAAERRRRPPPARDDQVIIAWNGLMVSALARAHEVLGVAEWKTAAVRALMVMRSRVWDSRRRMLWRSYRDGEVVGEATLADFAMLIQSILDVQQLDPHGDWLSWAQELQDRQDELFRNEYGGYLSVVVQVPGWTWTSEDPCDGPEPSAIGISALNLVRLTELTGQWKYAEQADAIFRRYAVHLRKAPAQVPSLVAALDRREHGAVEVQLCGPEAVVGEWARVAWQPYVPDVVIRRDGVGRPEGPGQAVVARVCGGRSCRPPVDDAEQLRRVLFEVAAPGNEA